MNKDYQSDLDKVTRLALDEDIAGLVDMLALSADIISFSLECVGKGLRKGTIKVGADDVQITHFAHMCRVAYMMMHLFPNDTFGRSLAIVHDTKEEALPGMESKWEEASAMADIKGISEAVCLLTENDPDSEEIIGASHYISEKFDFLYVAKYKNYIHLLGDVWEFVGNMELCDRLDAVSSFSYLEDSRYDSRRKYKALETFGRIWATIDLSKDPLVEIIKDRCRAWFDKFEVTEEEVQKVSLFFKS